MRAATLFFVCLFATAPADAQDTVIVIYPDSSGATLEQRELPVIVAEEVIRFFNAPTTTRLIGRSRLPRGNEWRGNVAVRTGPVAVAGRVQGSLVVVNGDVALEPGAEITGDLIVVGGAVAGVTDARISGAVREYREPLAYGVDGDKLVYAPNLWRRFRSLGARRTWGDEDARSTLTIATGGTFNRVEGVPIVFGPLFDWEVAPRTRVRLDALGVFRSAGDLSDSRSDLGYMLRAEVRRGEVRTVGLGFRAFDIVAPVEDWGGGLRNAEVGWAAFLFHRDYRDYYLNKGVAGRVFAQVERQLQLAFEVRREWQTSVSARDPWTIFRTHQIWRANPPVDDGHYVTFAGAVTIDTRNDREDPTSGWFARTQVEHSRSRDVTPQTGVPASVRRAIPTDGSYAFQRVFVDLRRYSRVSPSGRVNLRVLMGGWLGGDALPLQKRLAIGGPDPLSGYAFRASACHRNIGDPAFAGSLVAACDRALLVQAEYRWHVNWSWTYDPRERSGDRREALIRIDGPDLVVFGDAGQAWIVGHGPGRVPSDRLPTVGTWLADLGLGVDWGGLGFYVAKAGTVGEPLRFTIRLDHRF